MIATWSIQRKSELLETLMYRENMEYVQREGFNWHSAKCLHAVTKFTQVILQDAGGES